MITGVLMVDIHTAAFIKNRIPFWDPVFLTVDGLSFAYIVFCNG